MEWVLNTWYLCQLLGLCLSFLNLLSSALFCGAGSVWDTACHSSALTATPCGFCQWGNQRETTRLEEGEGIPLLLVGMDLLLIPGNLTSAMLILPNRGSFFPEEPEFRIEFLPHLQDNFIKYPWKYQLQPAGAPSSEILGPSHFPPFFPTSRGGSSFP